MSTHINDRTSTDTRPIFDGGTTRTVGASAPAPAPTPNHRRPSWMVTVGAAIGALLVVGAGILVVDSITEPAPSGTVGNTDAGASQRLVQESIDAALAESGRASSGAGAGGSYDAVEANRVEVLRDLSTAPTAGTSQRLVRSRSTPHSPRTSADPTTADSATVQVGADDRRRHDHP